MIIADFVKEFGKRCSIEMNSQYERVLPVCASNFPFPWKRHCMPFVKNTREDMYRSIFTEKIHINDFIDTLIRATRFKFFQEFLHALLTMPVNKRISANTVCDVIKYFEMVREQYKNPVLVCVNNSRTEVTCGKHSFLDYWYGPLLKINEEDGVYVDVPLLIICEKDDAPYLDFSPRYFQNKNWFPNNIPIVDDVRKVLSVRLQNCSFDTEKNDWIHIDEFIVFNDMSIITSLKECIRIELPFLCAI